MDGGPRPLAALLAQTVALPPGHCSLCPLRIARPRLGETGEEAAVGEWALAPAASLVALVRSVVQKGRLWPTT
eukprot:411099-Alexandrium_andersonii.AAC.1